MTKTVYYQFVISLGLCLLALFTSSCHTHPYEAAGDIVSATVWGTIDVIDYLEAKGSGDSTLSSNPILTVYPEKYIGKERVNLQWQDGQLHIGDSIFFNPTTGDFHKTGKSVLSADHINSGLTRFCLRSKGEPTRFIKGNYRGPMAYANEVLLFPEANELKVFTDGSAYLSEIVSSTVGSLGGLVGATLGTVFSLPEKFYGALGFKEKSNCNGQDCDTYRSESIDGIGYKRFFYLRNDLALPYGDILEVAIDDDYNIAIYSDKEVYTILKWNEETGLRELCSFVHYGEEDWLLWTPQKYFTQGLLTTSWSYPTYRLERHGKVNFSQLADVFQRPDLVKAQLMSPIGITDNAVGETILQALNNPPPLVSILSPAKNTSTTKRHTTISFTVQEKGGGGIGDVRLYHNGKLAWSKGYYRTSSLQPKTQLANVKVSDVYRQVDARVRSKPLIPQIFPNDSAGITLHKNKNQNRYEATIELIDGENILSVEAFNRNNSVLSILQSVRVTAQIPSPPPSIYLLTIGINNFTSEKDNLTFAANDAIEVAKTLQISLRGKTVHSYMLLNHEATKKNIYSTLQEITARSHPNDKLIVYFATHGFLDDSRYYLITSDFDGEIRKNNAITSDEFMNIIKRIPALEQWLILDTCHAGGVGLLSDELFSARTRVLARSMGVHLFAGASTLENAQEGYRGHGYFTYFLIDGLKGNADKNRDRKITIEELGEYLQMKIPPVSNWKQIPQIKHYGEWTTPMRF